MERGDPTEGTILVVDDDPMLRAPLADGLTKAGYAVDEAETGENALAAAGSSRPALVLLDVRLPGISGYEVCLTARERQVLTLLTESHGQNDVAAQLFISTHTVARHIERILKKLGVHSGAESVRLALSAGRLHSHP